MRSLSAITLLILALAIMQPANAQRKPDYAGVYAREQGELGILLNKDRLLGEIAMRSSTSA